MSLSDGTIEKPKLNHFDASGQAHMVDVSPKAETLRIATATGKIKVSPQVYEAITSGTAKKGDVLGAARLAGIMGAKKTSDLIPLCHPQHKMLEGMVIGADILIVPVLHPKASRNRSQLDKSQSLIEMSCMNIALHHSIEL